MKNMRLTIQNQQAEITRLNTIIARIREALKYYGNHLDYCKAPIECTCGFTKATLLGDQKPHQSETGT